MFLETMLDLDHGVLMWANFPIFGDYNRRQNLNFDSEDLINLFLINDPQGKKKFAYLSVPGLVFTLEVQSGLSPSRALFVFGNVMYGVFGENVYSFDEMLNKTLLGTLETTVGYVSIDANNGGQIIFVDGQFGYIWNTLTTTWAKITDVNFPTAPIDAIFLDGFFCVLEGLTTEFSLSELNNGLVWPPDSFAQVQAYPGTNVGCGIVNRRIYFFKETSTEVWYNAGQSGAVPFRPDRNLLFNYGCLTPASIASDFGYLFWLARDESGIGSVMMTTGQTPVKISDPSIDELISSFTDPSDISCYIYKDDGHVFYVMNWTTDDTTLVVDVTMNNSWHKMQMIQHKPVLDVVYSANTRHLGNCHAFFNDKHYLGSYKAPILYQFSRDFPNNDGETMRRVRVCPPWFVEGYRMAQINLIQIDMAYGTNIDIGLEVDSQLYISISRDGGHTYGSDVGASMGKIGNTLARALYRNKGICRSLVVKISCYANVTGFALLGGAIDYEELDK